MVRRTENGSTLEQTYQIQNLMSSTRSFNVVRFVDGDLRFDESISDFGAASEDGRTLSELDMGDDPQAASTCVGITDSGGTPDGFTIQEYPYAEFIFEFGGIPPGDNGLIAGDNNGDRVTDFGYDVTLALESFFTTGGGQTVTYTSITRFGDQTLVPRATLMWDPPDPASTLVEAAAAPAGDTDRFRQRPACCCTARTSSRRPAIQRLFVEYHASRSVGRHVLVRARDTDDSTGADGRRREFLCRDRNVNPAKAPHRTRPVPTCRRRHLRRSRSRV
ncbi:MAG: hypothetical protein IPF82_07200 [Blastocatellia bacterium]|nr:hypothetical protein [Blastocatellia bacterium]